MASSTSSAAPKTRYTTEVLGYKLLLLGKRTDVGKPPATEEPAAEAEPELPEDDIPF